MAQYELNLRDYIRVFQKRKLIIILATLSLGFFSFLFATLQKPIPLFRAVSSVKIDRSSSVTGLYLQMVSYDKSGSLDTQATIIKSIPIMELVAKRLGVIREDLTSDEIRREARYIDRVMDMRSRVSTSLEGHTNIINIEVIDKDPIFAQRLSNTVAVVYKEQNTYDKNKRIIEAKRYIEKQLKFTAEQLKTAQESLRTFREKNRLVTIESQTNETLRLLNESEKELAVVKREMIEIEALVDELQRQKNLPKEKVEGFYAEKVSPIFSSLNNKLVDLYTQRGLALLDYNENHPEIKRMDTQIDTIISNMINHLNDQMKRFTEKANYLSDQLKKAQDKFNALPRLGLELEKIEHDLKMNKEKYETLTAKLQEVLISEAEKVEEVTIVRPALEPRYPINPPATGKTAVIGTVMGLIIGFVMAFIFETFDTSIGTIEDVEALLGIPVLGVIPFARKEEIEETLVSRVNVGDSKDLPERYLRLFTHFAPKSTLAESYRTLRTGVKFLCLEKGIKTILVSSSSAGEGKSTAAINLAITLAQSGCKTLLVEADLRKPVISGIFGIDREPGLCDAILGNCDWKETVRTVADLMMGAMNMEEIMITPGFDNLHIITSGEMPPNPSEIINSQRMTDFLTQAKAAYDVVVVDTAPILPVTDAAILGSKVDGIIILYRVGKIARGALKRAKIQMEQVKANILGVILNGLKPEMSSDYYQYGYDRYYAYHDTGVLVKLPWYRRLLGKIRSFIVRDKDKAEKKQKSPQAEKAFSEKAYGSAWTSYIKIALLAAATIALIVGLLWQFEIIKAGHSAMEK